MTDNKQNARKQAQRRARQRKQRNRRIALTACLMIAVMVASIGGTLAWLTDQTAPVVNTFTSSNIDITLTETGATTSDDGQQNKSFQMVPGKPIDKDPVVTVENGSEDCWLFVKVEESTNLDQFIDYTMASGWTHLNNTTNVYYRKVSASTQDQSFSIIGYNVPNDDDTTTFVENKVLVKNTVTKANMDALEAGTAESPTLTFTAYAVQYYGFEDDVAGAWTRAQALQTTNP